MNLTTNEQKIYDDLKYWGALNRDELVEITGLPRSTISDNLTKLEIKGLIVTIDVKHKHDKSDKLKKKVGRPTKYFDLIYLKKV